MRAGLENSHLSMYSTVKKKKKSYGCSYVYRQEQTLAGRKKVVSHAISKFRDEARAGITFD